jgi:hypothetical protein
MNKLICFVAVFVIGAGAATTDEPQFLTAYTDSFKEYYARILTKEFIFPKDHPVRELKSIKSPTGIWRAEIVQSDTGTVPYDKTKAAIVIKRYDGEKRYVKCERFRTITVQWINDRLIYILCDLGHVASVGQILDVEKNEWIYQKGETYYYNEELKDKSVSTIVNPREN